MSEAMFRLDGRTTSSAIESSLSWAQAPMELRRLVSNSEQVSAATVSTDTPTEEKWRDYLTASVTKRLYAQAQFDAAVSLFQRLPPNLQVIPTTNPGDAGSLQLSWDDGEKYLEIEILKDKRVHWFFRNRGTDERLGTQESEAVVPDEFFERFRTLNHKR